MEGSPEYESEKATAKAIIIAIGAIEPFIKLRKNDPGELSLAVEPLFGFSWSRGVIIKIGSKILNDFLKLVKSSELPKDEIDKVRNLVKNAYFDQSGIFPPKWEHWRDLITKYHLYEVTPFGERSKLVWLLEETRISSPLDLAELNKEEANLLEARLESKGNTILLWKTTLCWKENNPKKKGKFKETTHKDVSELVHALRYDNISETLFLRIGWI